MPPPRTGVIQFALKAISAETFISREKAVLGSPELLGFPLEMEFRALDPFTGNTLSCSQIFSDTKFYIYIVDALHRQLMAIESTLIYAVPELSVFTEGSRLIMFVFYSFTMKILISFHIRNFLWRNKEAHYVSYLLRDIIRETQVIRVGAAGFYMVSHEEALDGQRNSLMLLTILITGSKDHWYTFFSTLSRVANPVIPPKRDWPFYPVENILNDIRNALRLVFYSTHSQLASSADSSKKYRDLWMQLGEDYMIQPESTLKFRKAQRRCCNICCIRSTLGTAKLRCCKRCREMYYCGRECQKMCAVN